MGRKSRRNRGGRPPVTAPKNTIPAPSSTGSTTPGRRNALILLFVAALGFGIYWNSLEGEFVFDDNPHIVDSSDLHDISNVKRWWNHDERRPIGYMTLALNYHFHGLDVRGYHLVNVAIHVVNAWLVFALFSLTLRTPVMARQPISVHRRTLAMCAALAFVSHPIMTQAVAYIVQRLASLAALFYLLALVLYAVGRMSERSNGAPFFVGAVLAGGMAMLTKENAATLPAAVLLYEVCFLREGRSWLTGRHLLVAGAIVGIGLLFVTGLLGINVSEILRTIPPTQGHTYTLTPLTYLLTQFSVVVTYLRLLVLPVNQNLDYDYRIGYSLFEMRTILSLALLLGLLTVAVLLYRRSRLASFGILWWFLTLSIESSIIPIPNVIFEHRVYLPMVGFCCVVAAVLGKLLNHGYQRATAAFLVLVAIWGVMTYKRNEVWRDTMTMWTDVVQKSPGKARPLYNLGTAFEDREQDDTALEYYQRAIEANERYDRPLYNASRIFKRRGNSVQEKRLLERAIEANPSYVPALIHYGLWWQTNGDYESAMQYYDRALAIKPNHVVALINSGTLYGKLGDHESAAASYRRVLRADSENKVARVNLGNQLVHMEKYQEAIGEYEKALQLEGAGSAVPMRLAYAYMKTKDYERAAHYYGMAATADPSDASIQNDLGTAHFMAGDYVAAVEAYDRALATDPRHKTAAANRVKALRKLEQGQ